MHGTSNTCLLSNTTKKCIFQILIRMNYKNTYIYNYKNVCAFFLIAKLETFFIQSNKGLLSSGNITHIEINKLRSTLNMKYLSGVDIAEPAQKKIKVKVTKVCEEIETLKSALPSKIQNNMQINAWILCLRQVICRISKFVYFQFFLHFQYMCYLQKRVF